MAIRKTDLLVTNTACLVIGTLAGGHIAANLEQREAEDRLAATPEMTAINRGVAAAEIDAVTRECKQPGRSTIDAFAPGTTQMTIHCPDGRVAYAPLKEAYPMRRGEMQIVITPLTPAKLD